MAGDEETSSGEDWYSLMATEHFDHSSHQGARTHLLVLRSHQ